MKERANFMSHPHKHLNDDDRKQLSSLQTLLSTPATSEVKLQLAMEFLSDHRSNYHWVGIYKLVDQELILGPYVGPETDHIRIPVGRGVCGTAVAEGKNQIVPDVRTLSNYLACNLGTRSEIVVLVRDPRDKSILGQIDVDGTELDQFDEREEEFLEEIATLLASYF